jgi:hypothetical protein
MHSTPTTRESDPHDIFVIEPEVVLAARVDHAASDPHDPISRPLAPQPSFDVSVGVVPVDTRYRAVAVDDLLSEEPPRTGKFAKQTALALFAVCGAIAAAAWQHYGGTAKDTIAGFAPPSVMGSSGALSPAETTRDNTEQADSSAGQAAADQAMRTPPAPLSAEAVAAQAAQLPSIGRDVATMRQEIEQLRASIQQLKAVQDQMTRDIAGNGAKNPRAIGISEPYPRPRVSSPLRSAAAPANRPRQGNAASLSTAAPAAATAPALPQALVPPPPPAPESQASAPSDGGPVLRPPMPMR